MRLTSAPESAQLALTSVSHLDPDSLPTSHAKGPYRTEFYDSKSPRGKQSKANHQMRVSDRAFVCIREQCLTINNRFTHFSMDL